MADITSAVVLAAGEGRRLRPLTRYQPKPMVPVANRPIIEYVIDALLRAGITHIVIVVGHQRTRIQDHLTQRYSDLDVTYIHQPHQLGSGDALAHADDAVSGEFVVVNGDNVIDARMVERTVARYIEGDVVATVAVGPSESASEYGTVCIENDRITTILERSGGTEMGRINVGVYVFDDAIFDALVRTVTRSGELSLTDAIPHLPGRVVPAAPEGVWFDPAYPWDLLSITERLQSAHPELVSGHPHQSAIDSTRHAHESAIESAAPAQKVTTDRTEDASESTIDKAEDASESTIKETDHPHESSSDETGQSYRSVSDEKDRPHDTIIHESARIHESVVIEDCVQVGPGCEISAGVVLRKGTCLQSDVSVGANAVLGRSLVGSDTHVGANTVVRDAVIGAEVTIGDGTTAPGGPADFVVANAIHRDQQLGSIVSDRADIGANVTLAPGSKIGANRAVPHGQTVAGTICDELEVAQ